MLENTSRSRKLLLSLELNKTPSTGLLGKEEPAINLGTRLTRIKREDLEKLIPTRDAIKAEKAKPIPKLYNLELENCYTVGEICKKYHINDSSVWAHVRKYSIPSRQIGNFVYIPKEEIDNLYKSDIK